eukprot:5950059-Pyramimonas_sp.AAC.1
MAKRRPSARSWSSCRREHLETLEQLKSCVIRSCNSRSCTSRSTAVAADAYAAAAAGRANH